MLTIRAITIREIRDARSGLYLEVFFTLGALSSQVAFFIFFDIHRVGFHYCFLLQLTTYYCLRALHLIENFDPSPLLIILKNLASQRNTLKKPHAFSFDFLRL